jgi:hypothetical protein
LSKGLSNGRWTFYEAFKIGVDRAGKRGKMCFDPIEKGIDGGFNMTVFMRRFFPMGFVSVLMGTVLIAGCSRLPWSKSKEKEDLPEGKTVSIENLEESKGENTPPKADKRPQKSRADEGKRKVPPEMTTGEGEKGETIALAPTAPADLTFSPVKSLTGLKRKICVLGFEDRTGLQTEENLCTGFRGQNGPPDGEIRGARHPEALTGIGENAKGRPG